MCRRLILAVLLTALSYAALGAESAKIGITKFEVAENLDPQLGSFLYEALLERMVASDKYTVVDWEEFDRVLKYVAKSQPNISEEDARRQAVNQLGIEKMYVGSLRKIGNSYYVSVKVLNLDLTVARFERGSASSETALDGVIHRLASRLLMSPEELAVAEESTIAQQPNERVEKARLYVKTDPPGARVRILNIKPRYHDGIELTPGSYLIEVSNKGYVTEKRWIRVPPGKDRNVYIQLNEREPESKSAQRTDERETARVRREPDERETVTLPQTPIHSPGFSETAEIGRDRDFIAYSNGVIYDTRTGLEWFVRNDYATSWNHAHAWAQNLSIGGGNWRMPSIKELSTIYEPGRGIRNMSQRFRNTGWYVWSSEKTTFLSAWRFNFRNGRKSKLNRIEGGTSGTRAFAVRSRR